jgi:predicted metal-binding membrane protein
MTSLPVTSRLTPRALPASAVLWFVAAIAWATIVVADATGLGAVLHHHALIESGPPLPIAVGLFLVSWQVMVAAMMLPSSSTTIKRQGSARFIGGYLAAWGVFGLACFAGDALVHRLVDTTPLLAANQWAVASAILAFAGVYQLTPLKAHFLEACRTTADHHSDSPLRSGVLHAIDCVGASGALMLLMFAAGFASLWWMVGLAALMFYEVRGARAAAAIRVSAVLLIWLALLATMSAVPGWAAA